MKTLIATFIVSTIALTGSAFAAKKNVDGMVGDAMIEASSTNGNFSGLTSADIDSLFYDHPTN